MVQAPVGQEVPAVKQIFVDLSVPAGIQLHVGQGVLAEWEVFAGKQAPVGY